MSDNRIVTVEEAQDERLQALWSDSLDAALAAATGLFAPDADGMDLPDVADNLTMRLWRILNFGYRSRPETVGQRYAAVVAVLREMLLAVRSVPTSLFIEDYLTVALRPVRHLQAGILAGTVCDLLDDLQRGLWTPHLTKPQLWTIRMAIARTLPALPPDSLAPLWEGLLGDDPIREAAMRLGVTMLREQHATAHLLFGLEQYPDHGLRTLLVNQLEQTGDPQAIPLLARLRRETAHSDWTLSRQIARALRVIERQSRNEQQRLLLRPTLAPTEDADSLLRPTRGGSSDDPDRLLRPAPPDTAPRKE